MRFLTVFERLLEHHGSQGWWPGETPFEVMVGAVLTQNTAWTNVERAITNLQQAGALSPGAISEAPHHLLAQWIRPAGYFNVKARRLQNFCRWYLEQGGHDGLSGWDTGALRHGLLSVNGVGYETADDMLLYAFDRPVFVIDAYTRRIFTRLGLVEDEAGYEDMRLRFEQALAEEKRRTRRAPGRRARYRGRAALFNEYHALIVVHGKDVCRKSPLCARCCLRRSCPSRQ